MTLAIQAASATADPARHTRLVAAAQQFEAIMLNELVKPLAQSTAPGDDADGSSGPMASFGTEAVAGALARSGALGFAQRLAGSVDQHAAPAHHFQESPQVPVATADNPRGGNQR